MASVHEMMTGLYEAGAIDKPTMRRFDRRCIVPIADLAPEEIRAIRRREEVSQAVFAIHLNVSTTTVSQWERGEKKPAGPSLKLLTLVKEKGLEAIA